MLASPSPAQGPEAMIFLTPFCLQFHAGRSAELKNPSAQRARITGLPFAPQQSNVCARNLRRRLSFGDQKEHTKMESNYATESAATSDSGKSVGIPSTSQTKHKNKKTVATRAKFETKVRAQTPRPPRVKSTEGKLVCRYCGSDDLAPSFKKRRDARCRTCFKKRYGSKKPGQRTARTDRKAKVAK
jgi:hypothetical protein